MESEKHILFVCTGNICRSPMAEGLLRHELRGEKGFRVSSAGVGAMDGRPPSVNSSLALRPLGIDISDIRSRALNDRIIQSTTHIFAMTRGHFDMILTFFPEAAERTYLVREFMADARDIADPFGQGPEVYVRCRDEIIEALPSILQFIQKND